MKNPRLSPYVTNLPPCAYSLLCRARRLPVAGLRRRPCWWFRWQTTRLLNEGLPGGESVAGIIGLHSRLPAGAWQAYDDFFCVCRYLGLTEEQILLLLLLRFSTEPRGLMA